MMPINNQKLKLIKQQHSHNIKNTKYLEINPTKDVKNVYNGNYKLLPREVKGQNKPGVVSHASKPSTFGHQDRWIT